MMRNKKNKMLKSKSWKNKYWLCLVLVIAFVFMIAVAISSKVSYASWVEEEDGIKYLLEDGQYAVGFIDVEEKRYYFDEDGHLLTGKFYVEDEDAYYYSDEEGVLQYGAIQTDDDFFIADENGRLMTGFAEYEGKRYYFNGIAQLVVGWFKHDDNWYYADGNGEIMTGFVTIDGYRYYLNDDGTRVSDSMLEIDGVTYIFNADGSVDENGTLLYPVYQFLNQLRVRAGQPELVVNSKVQSCAILRASELENGFTTEQVNSIETLLGNRGVLCSGGYEFAFGGIENYNIDRLIADIQKDANIMQILSERTISEVGIGAHERDGISYYDIIFISNKG